MAELVFYKLYITLVMLMLMLVVDTEELMLMLVVDTEELMDDYFHGLFLWNSHISCACFYITKISLFWSLNKVNQCMNIFWLCVFKTLNHRIITVTLLGHKLIYYIIPNNWIVQTVTCYQQ